MSKRAFLIKQVEESIHNETFVKFVMSKPTNSSELSKITARHVRIKGDDMISVVSSFKTNDVTKNYSVTDGLQTLLKLLKTSFENAALFTIVNNYQLEKTQSGNDKMHKSAPTTKRIQNRQHDHTKKRMVASDRPFLATLGVTTPEGDIKTKMNGKYKQVESFINILSNAINGCALNQSEKISVYDMGAGSAYVSFAIYDYVTNTLHKEVNLTGVDINVPLVKKNKSYASDLGFTGINFIASTITEIGNIETDIVVALHACNTATDDALYAGIQTDAQLIIVSPCCHQELRSKITAPQVLKPMFKFGTYTELQAEMLTDTIRTLILEINGYKTSLFEFVSDEHSGKNNIIVAVKKQSNQGRDKFKAQLAELKEFYGIKESLYLESLFI